MHFSSLSFLYPAVFLLGLSSGPAAAAKPRDAILLSEVESLTLRADRQTAHRRVPAVPQLRCVGPAALCARHRVDTMRCTNQGRGYDAEDVQWACRAALPPELKLGATDVACEGYAAPDDPYVLRGSCGVEYRLALTERGAERWPDLAGDLGGGGWAAGDWGAWLFGAVFVALLAWIVYAGCVRAEENRRAGPRRAGGNNNHWGGGGGGGPGGGWWPGGGGGFYDDPPPPYPGTSKPSGSQGWQPGFWSGLAGGAAAGYLAGNRGSGRRQDYGSSWGGGPAAGPSRSGSGSSSGSTSASRYESTGFGSTSRR